MFCPVRIILAVVDDPFLLDLFFLFCFLFPDLFNCDIYFRVRDNFGLYLEAAVFMGVAVPGFVENPFFEFFACPAYALAVNVPVAENCVERYIRALA